MASQTQIPPSSAPKVKMWVAVSEINVRAAPDTQATKLATLKQGVRVDDIQQVPNNPQWFYSPGIKGFMAAGSGSKSYWSLTEVQPKDANQLPSDYQGPVAPGQQKPAAKSEPKSKPTKPKMLDNGPVVLEQQKATMPDQPADDSQTVIKVGAVILGLGLLVMLFGGGK